MNKTESSRRIRLHKDAAIGGGRTELAGVSPKNPTLRPQRELQSGEPVGLLEQQFPDSEMHMETFEYFNPAARNVCLVGSFNRWRPDVDPMKNRRGKWSTQLLLRPGKYEYRFVVDGQWQDDPMASFFVSNPFGGLNCVREVKAMKG